MYEQKGHFVEHKTIFRVASFIDRHSLAPGGALGQKSVRSRQRAPKGSLRVDQKRWTFILRFIHSEIFLPRRLKISEGTGK